MIVKYTFRRFFWGLEEYFSSLKGVIDSESGYAGGNYENPDYKTVLKYRNQNSKKLKNYTETVHVVYDKSIISTKKLIEEFFELHNPTQGNRQGNDIGNNYRSMIFYTDDDQKYTAFALRDLYQQLLYKAGLGKITTKIEKLEKFYRAEDYHQDYLKKNPNGYCPNHRTNVKFTNSKDETRLFYQFLGKYKLGEDTEAYRDAF